MTFTDKMSVGERAEGQLEFAEVSVGPLAGRGYIRLSTREGVSELYGSHFDILSLDEASYTEANQEFTVSDWMLTCRKPE